MQCATMSQKICMCLHEIFLEETRNVCYIMGGWEILMRNNFMLFESECYLSKIFTCS